MYRSDAVPPLRVATVIGSTREGRVGAEIGSWFAGEVRGRPDIELTMIDLAGFEFPSSYPARPTTPMTEFTGMVRNAEAFVLVTPEYNRSFPASLKQAVDFAFDEWQAKPVGFVSYGCGSAGMYAVEQLRTVFTELHAVTMRNGVGVDLMDADASGRPPDTDRTRRAVDTMLDQLVWWGLALRDARAARPYVC